MSIHVVVAAAVIGALFRPWRVRPRPLVVGVEPRQVGLVVSSSARWGVLLVVGTWVSPYAGVGILVWPALHRWLASRARSRQLEADVAAAIPDVIDLIIMGVGAGSTIRGSLVRAEPWFPGPFREAFTDAVRRSERGEPFVVALEASAGPLGAAARPLIRALVAADRDGGAIAATLMREGDDARHRLRAGAQERARRLPVTMLLPLVLCVLPAFGLIAVMPLLLHSLGGLGLSL